MGRKSQRVAKVHGPDAPPAPTDPLRHRLFFVPQDRLLPLVCPECGAPGTAMHEVEPAGNTPPQHEDRPRLSYHLCASCAQARARAQTVRLAWVIVHALGGASLATACSVYFGQRGEALQLLLLLVFSGALLWITTRSSLLPVTLGYAVLHPSAPDGQARGAGTFIWARSSAFQEALIGHGFESPHLSEAEHERVARALRPRPALGLLLIPALITLLWWTGLHSIARARVRVINMGPQTAVLMIDDRRMTLAPATRFERPGLGVMIPVLAGPRDVSLVGASGKTLFEGRVALLPGQTAIVARLLPEQCLYVEERDYGRSDSGTHYSLFMQGIGAQVLPTAVDSWFSPLGEATLSSSKTGAADESWMKTQGKRRGLRLLPCP